MNEMLLKMEESIATTVAVDLQNDTPLYNATAMSLELSAHAARPSPVFLCALRILYVVGIVGNLAAIIALRRGERRMQNRKHLLMLTTLAANDLVALIGMLAMSITQDLLPGVDSTRSFCALLVVLRIFGIGSVCITVVMSLERWLALTRPFLYQKQVTYRVTRTALLLAWGWAALLTCLPLLGLGVYYDERDGGKCTRYRNAETDIDIAYAGFYVFFGTLLCVILVYCNLMVIKALYSISAPNSQDRLPVRRISKNSSRRHNSTVSWKTHSYNTATAEEVAFSKLMATLSVLFMICWLPQMITSSLFLAVRRVAWARLRLLAQLSDLLMLLNYVLITLQITSSLFLAVPGAAWARLRLLAQLSDLLMLLNYVLITLQITSSLFLAVRRAAWARLRLLAQLSDLLMLLNYVLDPYLYVLLRRHRFSLRRCLADLCSRGKFWQSHKSSTESIKTSATSCPQESLLISEHGSEMKVLPPTTCAESERRSDERTDGQNNVML